MNSKDRLEKITGIVMDDIAKYNEATDEQHIQLKGAFRLDDAQLLLDKSKLFWKDIIYKDGKIDEEQVMAELTDFYFLMHQVPLVYEHITGGAMSMIMYYADEVIRVADDYTTAVENENIEEAVEIAVKDIKAERDMLRDACIDALNALDDGDRNLIYGASKRCRIALEIVEASYE